jgi:carbamoyl-phosphate synthase small subunit
MSDAPAAVLLVLEDGTTMKGRAYGAVGETFGEAVFSTGMTGYQETLTDPSYRGQVVVMTSPHIGNTGMNDEDAESRRIWVSGYVVRDPARRLEFPVARSLDDDLIDADVVGISDIDTRALTRHLREAGAMRVGIFSGDGCSALRRRVARRSAFGSSDAGADLTGEVTVSEPYRFRAIGESRGVTVAAVDLGIKSMTPRRLSERGLHREGRAGVGLGADRWRSADGVFFSNGPGDPATAEHTVGSVQAALAQRRPVFGICFGHQMLGRALGLDTYKLRFGHRGINQPVHGSPHRKCRDHRPQPRLRRPSGGRGLKSRPTSAVSSEPCLPQ